MSTPTTSEIERLIQWLRPVGLFIGVMSFFINLLILPISLYALQVLDRVMSTGSIPTLLWLTLMMIVSFVIVGLLQTLRGMALIRTADWLHSELTAKALPLVLAQTTAGGRGAQHLRDANIIKQFLAGNGLVSLLDTPWSLVYIAVLFLIHPALGILVTVGAICLIALAWVNEIATRDLSKESNQQHLRNMQELESATRNAEVTQAMGMGHAIAKRWKTLQASIAALHIQSGNRSSVIQGITKFIRLSLQVLVTCVAAWFALAGDITIGAIIAASILASRALAPFEITIGSWKLFTDTRSAYSRLKKIFASDAEREESMSLPAPSGALSVQQLVYSAPEQEHPILQAVSFTLQPGEMLGIIGPSGAGKSTLARLIMGVYPPTSGVVRLDGADVYRWPRAEFGQYVGYVPQDVELFDGSVKDNIARFNEHATAETIVQAAKMAGAHELILQLPQGYETNIGAAGALLSAGQRQRIGLARAFFGNPRLLVLDEPDANLDDAGQQALINALRVAKQQRITTLLVTHRKSFLNHADKLLLLQGGRVGMFGPTAEVAASLTPPRTSKQPQRTHEVAS